MTVLVKVIVCPPAIFFSASTIILALLEREIEILLLLVVQSCPTLL